MAQALVSFKKYMPPMEEEGAYIFWMKQVPVHMSGATSGAGIAYHSRVHPHLLNAVLVIIIQSLVFCRVLCVSLFVLLCIVSPSSVYDCWLSLVYLNL